MRNLMIKRGRTPPSRFASESGCYISSKHRCHSLPSRCTPVDPGAKHVSHVAGEDRPGRTLEVLLTAPLQQSRAFGDLHREKPRVLVIGWLVTWFCIQHLEESLGVKDLLTKALHAFQDGLLRAHFDRQVYLMLQLYTQKYPSSLTSHQLMSCWSLAKCPCFHA